MTDTIPDKSENVVCSGKDCPEEEPVSRSTSGETEKEKKLTEKVMDLFCPDDYCEINTPTQAP
ncbi:MAG: hypothetical protein WA151_10090 [Desulfatirhabdiaceae bacterium]